MFFSGKASLMGLDVGSAAVKAVELAKKGERIVARRASIATVPDGIISNGVVLDPPTLGELIQNLCRGERLRSKGLAMALAGGDVLVTRLKIERGKEENLAGLVRQEAARILPFPIESASLDFQVIESASGSRWVEALVVAASAARVSGIEAIGMRTGKELRIVDAAACALANAYEFNYQPSPGEIATLVHVGAAWMTVCVVRGAIPVLARDVPLAAKGGEQEWSAAERAAVEIERVFESMDELADERPLEPRSAMVKKLVVSGGGARAKGLEDVLRRRFGVSIEEMNPFRRIEFERADSIGKRVWDHLHCMPVAVGLALRGVEG